MTTNFNDPANSCKIEKMAHDKCWFLWYRKDFIEGKAVSMACEEEWSNYKSCMMVELFFVIFILFS